MSINLLQNSFLVIGGLILLSYGADRFVTGASALARNLGVSPLLIGLTIVAFGTSAPEIVVSIVAALKGNVGIAIGNAIGSNITNIGFVIGLTALLFPLQVHSELLKREFPLLFFVMFICALMFANGYLSRLDGIVLLLGLVLLIAYLIRLGLQQRSSEPLSEEFAQQIPNQLTNRKIIFYLALGIILLPLGSELLVHGASQIARALGVSDLIIGLTIVAFGTSLPELFASLFSVMKEEDDIAIGNVLGSNMFNLLAVIGFPALINPSYFSDKVLQRDFIVMLALTFLLYLFSMTRKGVRKINRLNGLIFLSIYFAYITFLTRVAAQ